MANKKMQGNLTRAEREERKRKQNRADTAAVIITLVVLLAMLAVTITVPLAVRSCESSSDKPEESLGELSSISEQRDGDFVYAVMSTNEIAIKRYKGTAEVVTVPSEIDGKTVAYISDAFRENTTVREVYLPAGIKELDFGSFDGCQSLTKVSFHKGMTYIDDNSFRGCTSLTTVEFFGNDNDFASIDVRNSGNESFLAANIEYKNLS